MYADLKFALRQLRKSPGFAITAILTLALGIGLNTAVFSFMDALVLHPLAVPDMSHVVTVEEEAQDRADGQWVTLANYQDWGAQSRSFEDLAVRANRAMSLTEAGGATHIDAAEVSTNFFQVLRATPIMGRVFRADEAQPGRDAEAVLSFSFWQRQFGGDAGIVGRSIQINERAYTVVGVMPRTLAYPSEADMFVPFAPAADQRLNRSAHDYQVVGRLRSGVTVAQAQAELQGIAVRLAKAYPATNLGWGVKVTPLLVAVSGTLTPLYFRMVLGATGFVLLIVCANIANLQFARGLGRRNEMALRTALGAKRLRLLRQLLAESVLLGVAGAAAGLLLAKLDLQICLAFMPERVARYVAGWGHVSLNGRALALSIVLAVVAGIVSGVAPALEALRVNLVDQLKSGGRTSTGSGSAHRLRNIFAVCQIALAVALVIGAALMAKGMWAMLHIADVHDPKQVLTFQGQLPVERYNTPAKQAAWYADSLSRIRALPGVKTAALATYLPEGNDGTWQDDFRIDNRALIPGKSQSAARLSVSGGYFDALHIPLAEGRTFRESDGLTAAPVAIVSRSFAAQYFPGTTALGHRIRMGASRHSDEPWMTIVGVAENLGYDWTNPSGSLAIYLNSAQIPPTGTKYVVVAEGDPLALAPAVRKSLAAIDATLPLDAMQTYDGYIREALTGLMYVASMLGVDAAIALLLAAIGIFGVMANLVGERRREIGIRFTFGARRGDVSRMFLGRAGRLAAIGIAAGVVMAAGLARLAASLFYGVHPGDLAIFVTIPVTIFGIALAASWLPVRVASLIDPVQAMRDQ
ncbi:putative permease [Silvibacterium bohemicum]|uniref:Putative permease n=1 Tax=Silvibacterium bohemicum TaxID=1577686 RepID=A0A841K365_9BACT|nr:ABC transporter permease [Silvibacterium bohemicum]MBB6145068.1 putative permease [Silvibacterium bohemicum]